MKSACNKNLHFKAHTQPRTHAPAHTHSPHLHPTSPKTSCGLPRPPKSFSLHFAIMYKVRVEPQPPGSKLQASPSHHSMAAPHSFHLSGVAEYRWPPERRADIELAGRLWGGVLAAKIITCHTGR